MSQALQPKIEIFNPYERPFSESHEYINGDSQLTKLDFRVSEFIKRGTNNAGDKIVCKCTPCQCCACR